MELSLGEQLLLLSYDDASGKPLIPASHLDYGQAGAYLLELFYAGRIGIEHGKLVALDRQSPDPVLVKMRAERPRSAVWWVLHLASPQRRQELLERLVDKGLLRRAEHKVLGIFPVRAYPEVDTTLERQIIDHLREVLIGATEPDRESVGLLGLIHVCGLDQKLFPDLDVKLIRRRIHELTEGDWSAPAVRRAITIMNAAVLAAVSGGIVSSNAGAVTTP
ncbi:MAG TPA: GPP34 family phosphoprotein [Micromonosporaceae bacterium]|nr:GPP34 family phosphoprotein [Micromonosporaceae bacterium]